MDTHPSPPITPVTTPFLTQLPTAPSSRSASPERSKALLDQSNLAPTSTSLPTPAVSPTSATPAHPENETDLPRKRNQVKRACVNCQKACKKCDNGRPCSRCIKFGLEKTCADSARKERQRVGVKRGPYKQTGRSGSIDHGHDDGLGPAAGWSKLDILSRICNTVLVHARETTSGNESGTIDDPEVLAARSLEIIANRARGVDADSLDSSPDPERYEYDHHHFDHQCLVQEAYRKGFAPFGNIRFDHLAATLGSTSFSATGSLGSYGSMYSFGAISNLDSLSGSPLNDFEYSSVRFSHYGLPGYSALSYEPPTIVQVREPNPLDDFAAISDTVRRMEDEASARSKKRKSASLGTTAAPSATLPASGVTSNVPMATTNGNRTTPAVPSGVPPHDGKEGNGFGGGIGGGGAGYPRMSSLNVTTFPVAAAAERMTGYLHGTSFAKSMTTHGPYPPVVSILPPHKSNGVERTLSSSPMYSPPTPPEFCVPSEGLLEPDAKRVRLDVI
ncbi:hypothetical protein SpCBS45565_g08165 [Spizellomyces sp. 'palustris']|nr:hypothetical protein SpCBS45565_g08165 [Spizellomyces sp. 'palustris']